MICIDLNLMDIYQTAMNDIQVSRSEQNSHWTELSLNWIALKFPDSVCTGMPEIDLTEKVWTERNWDFSALKWTYMRRNVLSP